jgi:signal transduction histidine kinase
MQNEATLPGGATEYSRKTRWILLAAFGGMLALMILGGVESLRSLRKLNQVSTEVGEQFSARSHVLVAVVVSYHTYTDQMEQYLLKDEAASDATGAGEVTERGSAVHTVIRKYPPDCAADERLLLAQIEKSLSSEESEFGEVLAGHDGDRKQRGHRLVFEKLTPDKTQILQLANALAALNDQRFGEQSQAIALQFQGLQLRITRLVFLTLLAGLLLSLIAAYYILRLEQRGRERYLALAANRKELESLSRRLVDAQEIERRSISRELHDEVGQTLGALLMDIGHLSSLLSPGDKLAQEQIFRIRASAESAVKSIRDMALLLRPPMLDDLGLVPALEWQARETSRHSEMEVEVQAAELAGDPPNAVKVCIYRVVQEALHNAAAHSRAKNAKVVLKSEEHRVLVDISDDGDGFQPERTRGMGILGMEERVRQLAGVFSIQSAPGQRTKLHVELPLNAARGG